MQRPDNAELEELEQLEEERYRFVVEIHAEGRRVEPTDRPEESPNGT